jgi:N-acetyl-gamma-glutamyl-phosphate reductase
MTILEAMTVEVCVVGTSGFTGGELSKLLDGHPHFSLHTMFYNSNKYSDVFTSIPLDCENEEPITSLNLEYLEENNISVVFLCLPHGKTFDVYKQIQNFDGIVIDLSGDFRLAPQIYEKWYGTKHTMPEEQPKFISGFVEVNSNLFSTQSSKLRVAMPGCFVTASTLALLPIKHKIDTSVKVNFFATTGISGAGKEANQNTSYYSVSDNVRPYRFGTHQHSPEIAGHLDLAEDELLFFPHKVPMTRGMTSLGVAKLKDLDGSESTESLTKLYKDFYNEFPMVHVVDAPPETKAVQNTNLALVNVQFEDGYVYASSAIDNLVKGAAGHALQTANIIFNRDQAMGLITKGAVI